MRFEANCVAAAAIAIGLCAASAGAQHPDSATASDTSLTTTLGGFVDTYYAYDFGRPREIDRAFTTQATRHNEFNVNLAYVEMTATGARVHGRLALQAGTSVQANYAGEDTIGSVSGPSLARNIQEAYVGVKLGRALWIDGGVFLSHIGVESFISRDNPTYTRSLAADYTPYYESGVRATWQTTPTLVTTAVLVNGWQNISENNQDKAVGARLDWSPSGRSTLSYYDFFGNETGPGRLRTLDGVGAKLAPTKRLTLLGNFDYGTQRRADRIGTDTWYGSALTARVQVAPAVAVAARVERYADPAQALVRTGESYGLRANGASVGVDVVPVPRTLWRTELRLLGNAHPVFPNRTRASGLSSDDGAVVTSLALTF
jgi:hypothetical protein